MRKIILLLCCVFLISCNSTAVSLEEYESLQDDYEKLQIDYEKMKSSNEDELSTTSEFHLIELQTLEDEKDEINRAFSVERKALVNQNKYQSRAYENYDQIYILAEKVVDELMFEDNIRYPDYNYINSRLDDVTYMYFDEFLEVYVYRFNYSFESQTPENILYAGPMHQKEDGWIQSTYPNSHYLIFKGKEYIGHFLINDASPGTDLFHDDLEKFLDRDALKTIRLDFIEGVDIYSLSAKVNVNYNIKRHNELYYRTNEIYFASVEGIYEKNFDVYTRLPSDDEVILEEKFETNLGMVTLLTLDSGENYTYTGYLEYSNEEGYLFNFSKEGSNFNTKLEFLRYLNSLEKIEITKYEGIELENVVIGRGDDIELVLKKGYYTNDTELWNASGPKWVGNYEFQVTAYNEVIVTDFKDVWVESFFYAPQFEITLRDYNNDGLMEFVLTQYMSTNICFYKMFTITEDKKIIETPFIDYYVMPGHFTRIQSPELEIVNNQIVMKFYNNTNSEYVTNYFQWNGKAYECVLTEKEPF